MARAAADDGTRLGRRRGWPLLAAVAVDALGTGLYLPLSLLFFLRVTDLDLAKSVAQRRRHPGRRTGKRGVKRSVIRLTCVTTIDRPVS